MPGHAQTSLSIHLRLRDSCRRPGYLSIIYWGLAAAFGSFVRFGAWRTFCAKISRRDILAVLAFGAVSLQLLGLGVPRPPPKP